MARVEPPNITPAPTPAPQRADRVTFSDRVDAFVLWLTGAVAQFQALATNVFNNAVDAFGSAGAAADSAAVATQQANVAATASNAQAWVSGTNYAAGVVVYSPIDKRSYRRATTGAGTTDPSADETNWVLLSQRGVTLCFHAREEQASGLAPGASVEGIQDRSLNAVRANNISGASLAASVITLPAGTYDCFIRVPPGGSPGQVSQAFLYNITDSLYQIIGASSNNSGDQLALGRFTITATKQFRVRQKTPAHAAGLGYAVNSGLLEIYTQAIFYKVG